MFVFNNNRRVWTLRYYMFHHRCGHDKHPHPCGHINSSKTTHFLLSSFLPFYQTRTVSYMTGISINWSRNSLPVRNTRVHSRFSIVLVSLFALLLLCSYVLLLACVCPFSFAIWSSLHDLVYLALITNGNLQH